MSVRFICLSTTDAEAPGLIAQFATPGDHCRMAARRPAAAEMGLLARAALRALLWRVTGSTAWRIAADARGKPWAYSPDGARGPAISISHSAGAVAVAVGPVAMALGIDIERHAIRDFVAIAAHAFSAEERAAVRAEGQAAFYRIWTTREAVAKVTGAGLAQSLGHGNVLGAGGFHVFTARPLPGFSLSIAADAPFDPEAVIPGL